jgi:putative hydrolase of the HAD superfamily
MQTVLGSSFTFLEFMPGSLVRVVFFDAVGTLIHPDPPAPIVYARIGQEFGSHYDAAAIKERFSEAFRAEEEIDRSNGWQTSEEREIERWRRIVESVLDDVGDPTICFRRLFDHFAGPGSWRCDPATGELLKSFEKHGYVLGLASNYDFRLRNVLAGKPELALLRHLCISSEVGWRKPAGEFFAAMSKLVGLPPEQIIHIGDDPVNDYQGAIAAGMHAVLFSRNFSLSD